MKNLFIRQETEKDHSQVYELIRLAFQHEPHSDQQEHHLVERLRKSEAYVPELSLVAERDDQLVGHILLTKIKVVYQKDKHLSLALAPVSVLPSFRNRGIGGALINEAHAVARQLGFSSVILLGHADYYPRFGYRPANQFNIRLPFEVPYENCMAIELKENALTDVKGMVEYPKAFFE
ncbi:N-acetyltransferase [Catalinimonas sp. 4WD22]|uniref:GNAT family N-acetyltransferase n=1 Tax=Catalinimonas locisalis TaxID=3133978 RepID=UPI0031012283